MLSNLFPLRARSTMPSRQSGVVLLIALVVLVAMTLAAISLVRSVDTSNLIAGNMAFQQAATRSADRGIETAIAWLDANKGGITLLADDGTNGYSTSGLNALQNPNSGESWDAYWMRALKTRAFHLAADGADNTVSYVIDRMCKLAGPQTGAGCADSPVVSAATGNGDEGNELQIDPNSVVYYRITVRVAGPRNTVSYVQAMVSM